MTSSSSEIGNLERAFCFVSLFLFVCLHRPFMESASIDKRNEYALNISEVTSMGNKF